MRSNSGPTRAARIAAKTSSRPTLPVGRTCRVHTRSRSLCLGQRGQRNSVAQRRVPLANLGKIEVGCLCGLRDIAGTVGVVPCSLPLERSGHRAGLFFFRGCRSDSKSLTGVYYPQINADASTKDDVL